MAGSVSKQVALDRLKACVEGTSGLEEAGWESPQFIRWRNDVTAAVRHIFADDPRRVEQFTWRLETILLPPFGSSTGQAEAFSRGLVETREVLNSMRDEVEQFWPDGAAADAVAAGTGRSHDADSRKVFVVHGRDEGMSSTVARFLEQLELTPIILRERPDGGRTVFAKLREESERVAYAVVLLTPDDEGRLRQTGNRLVPRARQDVIFELGYLLGRLGSRGVKALYSEGVELPSDYEGVLYIPMDARGAWKLQLCREMKAAGMAVDANRVVF